jgi:dienelactone hydrolase
MSNIPMIFAFIFDTQAQCSRLVMAALVMLCAVRPVCAQANWNLIDPLLKQHLQSQSVVANELQHFMLKRVPPLVLPADPKQWDEKAASIRTHELSVLYHGWPQQWIESSRTFEKVSVIEGHGYRIIKLRYEVIPGFYSVALLYEPERVSGKLPAILNLSGHGSGGKAVEHQQKRCINYALRGILALSLEWFDFGELDQPGNSHDSLGLLDLAGYNGLGLFYLEMRRGLDYLYDNSDVDRSRIGVTGVSGGGWQSIVLSSLDTRIGPAAPVAGFMSLTLSIERPDYSGDDAEPNASDFRQGVDYAQLVALRAPKPTLLIYNAMDDCCYRAGIVRQGVYSDIKPFFNLYGKSNNLQWYENQDPGTHNYGLDNRQASYRFFDSVFQINASPIEDPDTDTEVRSYEDLVVGIPKDNLTILGLAQLLAKSIHHEIPAHASRQWAEAQRALLCEVTRYAPATVTHAWPINATHERGIESHSYRFEFSNGLSATGVLLRSITARENAQTTILISDHGMASTDIVLTAAEDVNRGRRVLVLDPLFFGENVPGTGERLNVPVFSQLLAGVGERPLGLEAAQVTGVVRWLAQDLDHGSPTPHLPETSPNVPITRVQVITSGPRSETVAMVAAAINPEFFSELEARQSIPSLVYAFDHPLTYDEAPELMCLDLYRDFDFSSLAAIAAPVNINMSAKVPVPDFW